MKSTLPDCLLPDQRRCDPIGLFSGHQGERAFLPKPYRFSGTRISARSHARWAISDGTTLRVTLRNADQ
jgi:hypothetical protein